MNAARFVQATPIILLVFMFGLGASVKAQSANSVRVLVTMKTDHDDPKGSIDEVVKKHLEVELSGSASVQGEIKVTCTFFADELAADKVVALKSDDLKATLEAGNSTRLVSPVVTFKFTPQHSQKSGSGKRAKYKRIEAVGKRYHGWAVRAYAGEKLVGEAYSLPAIKRLMDGSR